MRDILSLLVFLGGVFLSIYLGFWCCTIGGIVDIVNSIKSSPVNSLGIALGIIKFGLSGIVGWGTFMVFVGVSNATK